MTKGEVDKLNAKCKAASDEHDAYHTVVKRYIVKLSGRELTLEERGTGEVFAGDRCLGNTIEEVKAQLSDGATIEEIK